MPGWVSPSSTESRCVPPGAGHLHHKAHRHRPPDLCRHVRRPTRPTRNDRADRDPDITAMTLRAPSRDDVSVDPVRVQIGAEAGGAQPYPPDRVELAEDPAPARWASMRPLPLRPDADHRRAAQSEWEPERHSSSATPRPHTVVINHWPQRLMKQALALRLGLGRPRAQQWQRPAVVSAKQSDGHGSAN